MRFLLPATVLFLFAVPPVLAAPAAGPDPTDDPAHADAWLSKHPLTIDAVPDINGPGACVSTAGNVWIKTTTLEHGQPVYDIVSAAGALIDRVQLPPFRTIAGFGPGVVYLAVVDPGGVVHVERAAIKRK